MEWSSCRGKTYWEGRFREFRDLEIEFGRRAATPGVSGVAKR
jgi:hypothetical protein